MKPTDKIQLVGGLLDLPILDADFRYCGIVDDVEIAQGKDAPYVRALLVGPGAYRGRLPGWAFHLVRLVVGAHVARVPWDAIEEIGSAVVLKVGGEAFALHRADDKARRLIPRRGAM